MNSRTGPHGAKYALATLLVMILAAAAGVGMRAQAEAATAAVPFSLDSPFRTPVPPDATVDPTGHAIVEHLVGEHRVFASLVEFGIPVYSAHADTPRHDVVCLRTGWGPCPFANRGTPIPDGARPHTGSDGAMVVVDEDAQLTYEFWQAFQVGPNWFTSFGAVNPLDGSGWDGAATGAGASRLGGVVRLHEIADGEIRHALAMQSDNACAGTFRWPATKTDGRSHLPDCVPQGSRLRLDPSIDLDAHDLSPAQRAVAHAMQDYGGYIVDVGGAPLSISFELAPDSTGNNPGRTYRDAGLRWDYDGLPDIPWEGLQLLAEPAR